MAAAAPHAAPIITARDIPQARAPHVAVVGAGPAGLMAAERLATGGCAVTIFEAMPSPARKFLLA
ncbi:MAG: NAD(P)-binding protein, partial [Verrucomicrobiae bacterium]|nr:NAD(P)-binding protein [Verrucomicrobiae bacterium]